MPGPTKLIGGNLQAGFYGEVPTKDFITGDELAKRIGLTDGISQYSNEPWLKFSYLGKVEFIAKKPFRHSISKNSLLNVGVVLGNKTITINGKIYIVRLIKGKREGLQNDNFNKEGVINQNSEWNKLLLPIHRNAPYSWKYPNNVKVPTENWNIGYSDGDLIATYNVGKGSRCWCYEYNYFRGGPDITYSYLIDGYMGHGEFGWRPVLELAE